MLLNLIRNPNLVFSLNLALREEVLRKKDKNYLNLLPPELIDEIVNNLDIEALLNLCETKPEYKYLCSEYYIKKKVKILKLKKIKRFYDKPEILTLIIKYRDDLDINQLKHILILAIKNNYHNVIQAISESSYDLTKIMSLVIRYRIFTIMRIGKDNWIEIFGWLYVNNYLKLAGAILNNSDIKINISRYNLKYIKYIIRKDDINNNKEIELIKSLLINYGINTIYIWHKLFDDMDENIFLELIKSLLAEPNFSIINNDNAVIWAGSNGYLKILQLLLADIRFDPADKNNLAIRFSSIYRHLEIVKILLADIRVNPAANNNQAIIWASSNDYLEIVKLLLNDPRVDPAARNNHAIKLAYNKKYTKIVELLLSNPRVNPNNLSLDELLNS